MLSRNVLTARAAELYIKGAGKKVKIFFAVFSTVVFILYHVICVFNTYVIRLLTCVSTYFLTYLLTYAQVRFMDVFSRDRAICRVFQKLFIHVSHFKYHTVNRFIFLSKHRVLKYWNNWSS